MRVKPRVVFDTNIYISAILFGGNPRQCLELARDKIIQLYSSRKILLELAEKLRDKFHWQEDDIREVVAGVLVFTELVKPTRTVSVIKEDPDDNMILECAEAANAEVIISGDRKHLLSLKNYRSISIISAKQFLNLLYKK